MQEEKRQGEKILLQRVVIDLIKLTNSYNLPLH